MDGPWKLYGRSELMDGPWKLYGRSELMDGPWELDNLLHSIELLPEELIHIRAF